MRSLMKFASLVLILCGCADFHDGPWPIEGSSYRIGRSVAEEKSDLNITVFSRSSDCLTEDVERAEREECHPRVDRAKGEVSFAFQLKDKEQNRTTYQPLQQSDLDVLHNGHPVGLTDFTLTPHGGKRSKQLFILLIDGSGSMYQEDNKIAKVQKALLLDSVVDGFFPKGGVKTGVVLLRFTNEVKGLDGGAPTVLTNKRMYRNMVKNYMASSQRGYTHLYDAVEYAVEPLLKEPSLVDWLNLNNAELTIVALTDGFNNERGDDKCETNAPRLKETLEKIAKVRTQPVGVRPTLYTVGFGKPVFPDFVAPDNLKARAGKLCGDMKQRPISNNLELEGIDNASLAWMAAVGGGVSYTKNNYRGLAEVFQAAASERFSWYQLVYNTQWFYHRRQFSTKLRLRNFAKAGATVEFYPSGWLDTRSGEGGDELMSTKRSSGWGATTLTMGWLGLLTFIFYLVPAGFNARRAVFRRRRKK